MWEFDTEGETDRLAGTARGAAHAGHRRALQLLMDPTDPYLWTGETPLGLQAHDFGALEVKMKTDAWGSLQVYWVTDESPEWYGPGQESGSPAN